MHQGQIANRHSAFGNRVGPEAHPDELSPFKRVVVGSTPTRPTSGIADCRLPDLIYSLTTNRKSAIANRQ